VVPAGAQPVPVSEGYMGLYRAQIADFVTAGRSSFTAVPGRQHNCPPFTLLAIACTHLHATPACAPAQVMTRLQARGFEPFSALSAVKNTCIGLLPSLCMCGSNDIAGETPLEFQAPY
jgi:hypothetical protein